MGFGDKALRRSDRAIFEPMAAFLSQIEQSVDVELTDIQCSEVTDFHHVGLVIKWEVRPHTYLHRCKGVWMEAQSPNSPKPSAFQPQFASIEEASVLLAALIISGSKSEMLEDKTTPGLNPINPLRVQDDVEREGERVFTILHELLLRSGSTPERSEEYALELAKGWELAVHNELGAEPDEPLGDLWVAEIEPRTQHGRKSLADLDARATHLVAHRVQVADIVAWWNLPASQRHLRKAENWALLDSEFQRRLNAIEVEGGETPIRIGSDRLAFLQAICTVPVFGDSISFRPEEMNDRLSPLPWEAFESVMDFMLKDVSERPRWRIDAIEARSYNHYFRLRQGLI